MLKTDDILLRIGLMHNENEDKRNFDLLPNLALKQLLEKCVAKENYELAAEVRDEIKKRELNKITFCRLEQ